MRLCCSSSIEGIGRSEDSSSWVGVSSSEEEEEDSSSVWLDLNPNQEGVECCEMVTIYSSDSRSLVNLDLLLRLAWVRTDVASDKRSFKRLLSEGSKVRLMDD